MPCARYVGDGRFLLTGWQPFVGQTAVDEVFESLVDALSAGREILEVAGIPENEYEVWAQPICEAYNLSDLLEYVSPVDLGFGDGAAIGGERGVEDGGTNGEATEIR